MKTTGKTWVFLGALVPLLLTGAAPTSAASVTVECALKLKYRVHVEVPTVDAVNRYTCAGSVVASSDVDLTDALALDRRQVVFALDNCPRLPARVVFGGRDVTEVRELRGDRTRAHQFSGECSRCVMAANISAVTDPLLDSAHFDARFVVRPYEISPQEPSIILPAGKGLISLRSERSDGVIVRGGWVARKCRIVPRPPIFCGGIAGIPCPDGMECVDWPGDDCDPDAGGADCIGVCQ